MKFDELYNKLMTENEDSPFDNKRVYHIYNIVASRGAINIDSHKDVKADSLEQAQQIAYNDFKEQFGAEDGYEGFLEIIPAKHSDVALVVGGEESYAVVSKRPLTDKQIEQYMSQDPEAGDTTSEDDSYEYKGWPGDGSGEDDFADYNQMEGNDY